MPKTVESQVIGILAKQALLEPAQIGMDSTLESLGLDSLGMVEAVFEIEEVFDIQVPVGEETHLNSPEAFSSVASTVALVDRLISEKET